MTEPAFKYEENQYNLSDLITHSSDLKDQASAADKLAQDLKARRKIVDKMILDIMSEQGVDRSGNLVATVTIVPKKFPNVTDWEAFYQYVLSTEALYLLQRRVSQKALEELANTGEEIPGVEFYEEDQLSLRKR